MKPLALFILLFFCLSCHNRNMEEEALACISVRKANKHISACLDSIRIVPLETVDSALVKTPSLFLYLSDIKKYLILDSRQVVFLFDASGRHVSNSAMCRGEGPQEYLMATDVDYNPYSHTMDIYDAGNGGIIHCYDTLFNWVQNRMIHQGNGFTAQSISVLDSALYALDPVRFHEDELYIRLYDFSQGEEPRSMDVHCDDAEYIAMLNMMQKCFVRTDSCIYYTPDYMDNCFYRFDRNSHSFYPLYKLDLDDKSATRKHLDRQFDEGSKRSVKQNVDIMQQKNDYLLSSDRMLPIIRLISDTYIYVHLLHNRKPYHLIYDRRRDEVFLASPESDVQLYRCFCLRDNVLYTLLYPYELEQYMDERSRSLMSDEMCNKLGQIAEEDNPVVVEYHLRK